LGPILERRRNHISLQQRQNQRWRQQLQQQQPLEGEEADEPIPEPMQRPWNPNVRMRRVTWAEAMGAEVRYRLGVTAGAVGRIRGWAGHRLRGMGVWAVRQFAHPFRSDEEGGKGYFYRSPWD